MNTTSILLSCVAALAWSASPPLRAQSCCEMPATSASAEAPSARPLPPASILHQAATWQDQNGNAFRLADLRGHPVVITMAFTHCAYACPRLMQDLKAIQESLPPAARADVRFVVASFDSVRDTPARLREWAALHNLGPEWTLLHGDPDTVRELSVLLDIPFQPQPDGNFAHANRIVLLDADGVPVTASAGLGIDPRPIVNAAAHLAAVP